VRGSGTDGDCQMIEIMYLNAVNHNAHVRTHTHTHSGFSLTGLYWSYSRLGSVPHKRMFEDNWTGFVQARCSLFDNWTRLLQATCSLSCPNVICKALNHHHHTTTILRPFFWDHPGEPVPEANFGLYNARGINRGEHTDRPAGRHSIQTNQCPRPPSPIFFTGWMPFLPPNQQCQSTEGNKRILIREKTLEFSSTVLPAPSP